MPTISYARTLIDYHYALFERIWESIMHLSDAQFVQDVAYSHGSLRNHMVHVTMVDTRWLRGLQGDPAARQYTLDPADYPTRAAVHTEWAATARAVTAYVASLDDTQLASHPPGMPGPAWHVIAQVVNHGTDHRAQILRILHDFAAPTFDQDLIWYLWFRS